MRGAAATDIGNSAAARRRVPLQVVGAGPAGISLVLALCNRAAAAGDGAADARHLLDGLLMFEAGARPGGRMGRYRINANTNAHDVVVGIHDGTPFESLRDAYLRHPDTQQDLIPLPRVGALMVEPLGARLVDYLGSRLRCATTVARVELERDGFSSFDEHDRLLAASDNLLLCCGARELPLPQLLPYRDRWEGSGRFLLREDLQGLPADGSAIVIVGASHSAFSCAWRLLQDPLFADFARGREIVVLQRRERIKLRCTPEFAAAHGIDYDPARDLCPATGLVFRNGGLRKDAKMLYLDIRDGREKRVRLETMDALDDKQPLLERAGLILQATGFDADLPLLERAGEALAVGNPSDRGELRDLETGRIFPGLYAMGLGFNILPAGDARGEPSFGGGLHGFLSYPGAIAPLLIDSIAARMKTEMRT